MDMMVNILILQFSCRLYFTCQREEDSKKSTGTQEGDRSSCNILVCTFNMTHWPAVISKPLQDLLVLYRVNFCLSATGYGQPRKTIRHLSVC